MATDGDLDLFSLAKPDWQRDAACRGMPAEVFFPNRGESTAEARATCARCDVQAECLEYSIDNNERHGVWAGLSAHQRIRGPTRKRRSAS